MGTIKKIGFMLNALAPREKIFLFGGSLFTALLLVYFFLIDPMWERTRLLSRLIPQKEEELKRFKTLQEEYLFLSAEINNIEQRLPQKDQFSPLSYLEAVATKNQIRENIAYIRSMPPISERPYAELPVEVRLEDIALHQIIPFLSTIENAPYFLRVKRLNIKTRFADPKKLDVTFVVSSYEKLGS